MAEALTTEQKLLNSIESLRSENFDNGQWVTDIYLDPEEEKIYTFLNTNCTPMSAYHGIDKRILTVHQGVNNDSVVEALMSVKDELLELIENYPGSEWDGNNWRGQWSESDLDTIEWLWNREWNLIYAWSADDWFGDSHNDIKQLWQDGKTAEQIVDELGTDSGDAYCDRDEAIELVEYLIDRFKEESEED